MATRSQSMIHEGFLQVFTTKKGRVGVLTDQPLLERHFDKLFLFTPGLFSHPLCRLPLPEQDELSTQGCTTGGTSPYETTSETSDHYHSYGYQFYDGAMDTN